MPFFVSKIQCRKYASLLNFNKVSLKWKNCLLKALLQNMIESDRWILNNLFFKSLVQIPSCTNHFHNLRRKNTHYFHGDFSSCRNYIGPRCTKLLKELSGRKEPYIEGRTISTTYMQPALSLLKRATCSGAIKIVATLSCVDELRRFYL